MTPASPGRTARPAEHVSFSWRRAPFVLIALSIVAALAMFAVGGSLLGPLDGDIPYPATAHEEATYDAGGALAWGGVAVAALTAVQVAVVAHRRRVRAAPGWGFFVFVLVASLGAATFFAAFGATT